MRVLTQRSVRGISLCEKLGVVGVDVRPVRVYRVSDRFGGDGAAAELARDFVGVFRGGDIVRFHC